MKEHSGKRDRIVERHRLSRLRRTTKFKRRKRSGIGPFGRMKGLT